MQMDGSEIPSIKDCKSGKRQLLESSAPTECFYAMRNKSKKKKCIQTWNIFRCMWEINVYADAIWLAAHSACMSKFEGLKTNVCVYRECAQQTSGDEWQTRSDMCAPMAMYPLMYPAVMYVCACQIIANRFVRVDKHLICRCAGRRLTQHTIRYFIFFEVFACWCVRTTQRTQWHAIAIHVHVYVERVIDS